MHLGRYECVVEPGTRVIGICIQKFCFPGKDADSRGTLIEGIDERPGEKTKYCCDCKGHDRNMLDATTNCACNHAQRIHRRRFIGLDEVMNLPQ
jgi:hypothetical protein